MSNAPQSFAAKLQAWLGKWWLEVLTTTLLGSSTGLARKFGEPLFDLAANTLGKTVTVSLFAWLALTAAYFGVLSWRRKKEKPETVRTIEGIDFRYGPRTLNRWVPCCPNCDVELRPRWDSYESLDCPVTCGWRSVLRPEQLLSILKEINGR